MSSQVICGQFWKFPSNNKRQDFYNPFQDTESALQLCPFIYVKAKTQCDGGGKTTCNALFFCVLIIFFLYNL